MDRVIPTQKQQSLTGRFILRQKDGIILILSNELQDAWQGDSKFSFGEKGRGQPPCPTFQTPS